MDYKTKFNFETRKTEVLNITAKYPDRIPIIVEKLYTSKAPIIDKNKYLVPFDITVGQFIFVIRKRMKLRAEEGLYLFINGNIPASSEMLINTYEKNKDLDGYLYIKYSSENTFGFFDKFFMLK